MKQFLAKKLKKWRFLLMCLMIYVSGAGVSYAQEIIVKGKVTDENGKSLPGVTVLLKGESGVGTTTDFDGDYKFDLPYKEDATLIFSFVGYSSQEVKVNNRTNIDVQLEPDVTALEEVVVIGYGEQKKVSMTSAVSSVSGEDLTERSTKNLSSNLQGLAPGLTVIDRGGAPGSANFSMLIRGVTTLGNNNPLVIIDGVEMNINDVDPNNVASVSVLKDAASTAIYGSRGANGVLVITTKRGKSGDIKINYNASVDIQNLTVEPEHMGTEDYLRLQNSAYNNWNNTTPYSEEEIQKYVNGEDRLRYPLPNAFYDAVIQKNAPMQRHVLSFSGGNDKLRTNVMLNYFDQKGIYPNQSAQQYRIRMNNDLKISDDVKLSMDLNLRRHDRYTFRNQDNVYHRMLHSSQFTVPRFPDGTYGMSAQGHNPLAWTDPEIVGATDATRDAGVINLKGSWNILKGLKFTSQYAVDFEKYASLTNIPTYEIRDYFNPDVVRKRNEVNELSENRRENIQTTWNNTLNYNIVKGAHDIGLLVGYSEISYNYRLSDNNGRGFYNNDLRDLSLSDPLNRNINSSYTDWGLRSAFGRLNYSFNEKYIVELNMRYDGSSRFPEENRYTFFPSVAGAWRISEESFWEPLKNIVEEFKIRGSWGETGNQNVGLYTYFENLHLTNYYVFNDVPVTGVRQNTFASHDLTWETTTQTNIGFDVGLFEGKWNMTFDWFDKITDGILLNLPFPGLVGLNPVATNAGSVQNKGWEVQLNHRNKIQDFRYNVTFNISDVKNQILDLAGTGPYLPGSNGWLARIEGEPINALYGYTTDGFLTQEDINDEYPVFASDAAPGDIKYVDISGTEGIPDGRITADDRTVIGSTVPRITYGTSINLGWKNFDFNMQLQGIGNKDVGLYGSLIEAGSWEGFTVDIVKDYWTPENTDAKFPRPQKRQKKNTRPSEWWVVNGAYLRLKNLQLGYTLPAEIMEKAGINKLRVFIGGTNLLTISELNEWGIDAETASGRGTFYPATKTYTLGLNINF
jgi:TonB-linked SusC/RagA family outer membrane protein